MTARVIAKMACWSREKMVGSDLQFYITWLKDQLKLNVMLIILYRVGLVVWQLGWVDLDLECSIILLGQ